MFKTEKLTVVMPVYQEEGAIADVLQKWSEKLDSMGLKYSIDVYDDGSTDHTAEILEQCALKYPGKINVCSKKNSGHGPTILRGYNEAVKNGADWIFQIDSDDEMGTEDFATLWEQREKFDFLVGRRSGRKQHLARRVISAVSRLCVWIFFGKSIWDVNSPYRLMRVSSFSSVYKNIPLDTFAPNLIISGAAAKKKMRCLEISVPQRDRQTGKVSIKKWKLLKAALRSFKQTIAAAFSGI